MGSVRLVRQAAYASLRKRPLTEMFVMTNALCKNAPRELEAWSHVVELAMSRNVPLVRWFLKPQQKNCSAACRMRSALEKNCQTQLSFEAILL
jgi:hypothetical protein